MQDINDLCGFERLFYIWVALDTTQEPFNQFNLPSVEAKELWS